MQGLRSQKKRSLHGVNEHFFDERNEAGGHYGQTNYIDPVLLNEGLPITVFSNEIIENDRYTMTINYTTGSTRSSDGGGAVTVLYPLRI